MSAVDVAALDDAAYIEHLVDQAPPLAPDQRDRLALLLRPGAQAALPPGSVPAAADRAEVAA